jgi:acyl carrier protein
VTPSTQDTAALADELTAFINDEVSLGDDPAAPDTDLLMSGLVDSLGVVMIVEWLERRLGIEIDPSDVVLEHFESVDAMVAYLRGRGDAGLG